MRKFLLKSLLIACAALVALSPICATGAPYDSEATDVAGLSPAQLPGESGVSPFALLAGLLIFTFGPVTVLLAVAFGLQRRKKKHRMKAP